MKLVHARRLASLEGLLAQLGQPRSGRRRRWEQRPRTLGRAPFALSRPRPTAAAPPQKRRRDRGRFPRRRSMPVASPVAAAEAVHPLAAASPPGEDARLSSIKAALFDQSKRFLSSCLDHLTGFRFENGEVHFTFKHKDSLYADLLKAREQQEVLRAVCAQVLGQPVRIYVTLEEQGAEAQALG